MITPTKLRTGDEVIVVAGRDLGKKGVTGIDWGGLMIPRNIHHLLA